LLGEEVVLVTIAMEEQEEVAQAKLEVIIMLLIIK